jgi:arylsulfatase A-like enzyme
VPFIAAYAISHIIYQKVFMSRKQPDLKVVAERDIASGADEHFPGRNKLIVSINNEVRECVKLSAGESLVMNAADCNRLAVGIGCREFGPVPLELAISGEKDGGERSIIFKKQFNPRSYFRDRVWNDFVIDPSAYRKEGALNKLIFLLDGPASSHVYLSLKEAADKPAKKKSDVYIFIIDGLRSEYLSADHTLGSRYKHLNDCLKESVVYPNAFSQGAWTLPTLGSMFTSLYPIWHGVNHPNLKQSLSSDVEALAELLQKNGYNTYSFVTGPRTSPQYGYYRGFDKYYYAICDKEHDRGTMRHAMEWMQEQDAALDDSDSRFFYLHLIDTHTPFYPPRFFEWRSTMISQHDVVRDVKKYKKIGKKVEFSKEEMGLYKKLHEAEIEHAFWRLDSFLMYLKGKGIYEDAFIIIAGDHGINFTEHRPINTLDLYNEYVNVGLAAKYPSRIRRAGICSDLVSSSLDLLPTVADVAGVGLTNNIHGKSLVKNDAGRDFVISEDLYKESYTVAIRTKKHTFIYRTRFDGSSFTNFNRENEVFELYDRETDKLEKNNIFSHVDNSVKKNFLDILNNHINEALKFNGKSKAIDIRA